MSVELNGLTEQHLPEQQQQQQSRSGRGAEQGRGRGEDKEQSRAGKMREETSDSSTGPELLSAGGA